MVETGEWKKFDAYFGKRRSRPEFAMSGFEDDFQIFHVLQAAEKVDWGNCRRGL